MNSGHVASRRAKYAPRKHALSKLTTAEEKALLCPIKNVDDYLPFPIQWLHPQPVSLSHIFAEPGESTPTTIEHQASGKHSVPLNTRKAKLPLHTGLEEFRQSKHWRANEQSVMELLELFAQDQSCINIVLSENQLLSFLAREYLWTEGPQRLPWEGIYVFAEADEARMQLLAQIDVLIHMLNRKPSFSQGRSYLIT